MKKKFIVLLFVLSVFIALNCFAANDEDSGGLIIFDKPVEGVVFDHQKHADLDCSDCHDDIFPQNAGETAETKNFSMKEMEKGETCGTCHDGDNAFNVTKNCVKCHVGKMNVIKLQQ